MYFRLNYWYMNVYILWVNTILNIFVPIVILVILNTLTFRSRGLTLFFTSLHPLSEGTLIQFEIYVRDLLSLYLHITSRKLTEHYRNLQENIETTNVTSVSLHREVK